MTWAGLGRFAIVFGLIWLAWINGAVYHDLHGRAEGRTRSYVFLQMGVLALLAVFTGNATAGDGPAFAVVYSAYLFLLGWLAPPPRLHIVLLTLVLGAVWVFGILTWYSFTHRDSSLPDTLG